MNGVIVTAGETSAEDSEVAKEEESSSDEEEVGNKTEPDYYDEHEDDQDEAFVIQQQQMDSKNMNSDAILSCPCCLTTLCRDCQQHERYKDQFRAMFVMNIAVQWNRALLYDDESKKMVGCCIPEPSTTTSKSVTMPVLKKDPETGQPVYYNVICGQCQTTVAALDMNDEVYHFYGCIASLPASITPVMNAS